MAHVTGTILIRRPVETVFDYVADQTHEPAYNPQMSVSTKLTPGPVGPGTRFRATVLTRGRPLDMDIEVTDYVRPTRLGTHTTMRSAQVTGGLTFHARGGDTRMSWDWDVRPAGPARFLGAIVTALGWRQEQAIWTGMKRVLEAEAPQMPRAVDAG